ncbi:MAG: heat-inducible transcription repressor HrcA [Chloroflexi bacterium]|nr:heat-inducible transcription repressor HrcA [Chloroflexota bacterium]
MTEALSVRRGRILKHVVEEYVITAQPVSSDVLVRKYVPSVSTATVRNELAALEEFGYLTHPHTSAGRVPSDLGYRYYVEWLMADVGLTETDERLISHQFHQVEFDIGEWIHLAASVLSARVQNPVMISPPVSSVSRLRRIDFVRIGIGVVLVVAMLRSGTIKQQVVRLHDDVSSEALTRLANEWNELLVGRSADELRDAAALSELPDVADAAVRMLDEADRQSVAGSGDVHVAGLSYIAAQPEFVTGDRFQPLVEALEQHIIPNALLGPLLASTGTYVAIGQEHPFDQLSGCSVVLARYGRPGEMLGVVGVIGPTRLPYWRAVPMVGYIARLLDRLIEETYLT